MDCYPDAAERFGSIKPGGRLSRLLRAVNRVVFRRLDQVIALDGAMAELLASQYAAGPDRPPVSVVPNWERSDRFPARASPTPWAGYDEMGIDGRIVVVYMGNAGVGHRFETVLDAAALLQHEAVFVFIGGGARRDDLEASAAERKLGNVMFHGYVPEEDAAGVMAGADGALITLDDRSLGLMSPSKLHANLAAGLPVLYVGPAGSNVDDAILAFDCGTSLREGDVEGLLAAVRGAAGRRRGAGPGPRGLRAGLLRHRCPSPLRRLPRRRAPARDHGQTPSRPRNQAAVRSRPSRSSTVGVPAEELRRPRDVRPALRGIVHRQRVVHDLARRAGHVEHELGQLARS